MEGILKNLLLLHGPEEIVEIRSVDPRPPLSGYFKAGSPNIAAQLARFPDRTFYQTLNCVDPGCYARAQREVLLPGPKETTSDRDIVGYAWILIDSDPVRPSGVSATDAEKKQAHRVLSAVYKHLQKTGFCDPVVADSGNGYHLLYRVRAEPGSREEIADFLKVLDMWFSNEHAVIDTAVFNPSRITKLYGTLARKGADTPDRPHRQSRILRVPDPLLPTPMALVRSVAAEKAKWTPAAPAPARSREAPFDVDAFLAEHHVDVVRKVAWNGATKYILRECPFNPAHKAPDAAVFVGGDGRLGFKCLHNSCADYSWHDFRARVDPAAYAGSAFHPARPLLPASSASPGAPPARPEAAGSAPEAPPPAMLDIAEVEDYDRSKITTIRSRLARLDGLIGGFNKGELSIWSGTNSSGKSTLVSQMGLAAVHQGYRVALFSGEMPPKLVKYWLYLQAAGRDQVEPDPLSPNHYRLKAGAKEKLNRWISGSFAVYNNDCGHSWQTVTDALFRWVRDQGADVVILDNLMSLNLPGEADRYEVQTRIVQALSQAAKTLDIHVHFVCHPRKTDAFLRKNDISGTGALTNTADNVFMVHRINQDFLLRVREVYPKLAVPEDAGNAVEIMKNRDLGVVDQLIPLYFDRTCKTMTDVKGGLPGYSWMEGFTPVDPSKDRDFPF